MKYYIIQEPGGVSVVSEKDAIQWSKDIARGNGIENITDKEALDNFIVTMWAEEILEKDIKEGLEILYDYL